MAIPPSFTDGQALFASQLSAATGLILVKTQTVGNTVSSVTVSDCFTSDYDSYKITYDNGTASTGVDLRFQLGSSSTAYYGFLIYGTYTAATVIGYNVNNGTLFPFFGGGDANYCWAGAEVHHPYLARHTIFTSLANGNGVNFWTFTARHAVANSYTSFTMSTNTGTISGGTIRVYGYRNS